VTGGGSQNSEIRAGHTQADGTFGDAPGGSLIIGTGDGIVQNGGESTARKLRTQPLLGARTRSRHMHDGQSLTFSDAITASRGGSETRDVLVPLAQRCAACRHICRGADLLSAQPFKLFGVSRIKVLRYAATPSCS